MLKRMILFLLGCVMAGALPLSLWAGQDSRQDPAEEIILWEHIWGQRHLLKMLLDPGVEAYGPYTLVKSKPMEQGRAVVSLEADTMINVLILPTSKKREQRLLPIHIYMGDGYLGYRVCLIKKGTRHDFDAINSLADWHESGLTMGTGSHWADTPILEANGLKFIRVAKYELLYTMLARGRFQCFPRGIDQLIRNLKEFGPQGRGLDLEIENRLLFTYPFFSIAFVSRKNPELKERILYGYSKVLDDASWKTHFQKQFDKERDKYKRLNLQQRALIPLDNPFMSQKSQNMDITPYVLNPLE